MKLKKLDKNYNYKIFHNFFDKFSISKSFENFLRKSFSKLIILFFFIAYLNFADLEGLLILISF